MKKISIVIPMYNEQEVAKECYKRIKNVLNNLNEYDHEIIIVDDGSIDKTLEIIEEISKIEKKVAILSFLRNFGHQSAVTAGLKETTGDAIVIIDADMQDPPETITKMVELWEQGNDVVYAVRTKRKGESIFKTISAKMFYKLLYNLSDVKIPKDTGDFRLADRKVVDVINSLPEHNKYLRGLFSWAGFKQKPLKLITIIGVLSIALSFFILVYTICSYIFKLNQLTAGWTSIMICITFFSGVQLLSIGIISEYISRIYDESKGRPEYIVKRKIKNEE